MNAGADRSGGNMPDQRTVDGPVARVPMYMAELRGKLALDSGTPADRTEDTLTAAVFGALRYLPRPALLAVLNRAFRGDFSQEEVNETRFEFWPRLGGVEPDLLLTVGKKVVVIEAKYGAPFSGAGGAIENHQLTQEYRAARVSSQARRQQGPWLLAVTRRLARTSGLAAGAPTPAGGGHGRDTGSVAVMAVNRA
jgi:hypothetical protein